LSAVVDFDRDPDPLLRNRDASARPRRRSSRRRAVVSSMRIESNRSVPPMRNGLVRIALRCARRCRPNRRGETRPGACHVLERERERTTPHPSTACPIELSSSAAHVATLFRQQR
jgi:hypothetical protein